MRVGEVKYVGVRDDLWPPRPERAYVGRVRTVVAAGKHLIETRHTACRAVRRKEWRGWRGLAGQSGSEAVRRNLRERKSEIGM
jgi:hypothetical protein